MLWRWLFLVCVISFLSIARIFPVAAEADGLPKKPVPALLVVQVTDSGGKPVTGGLISLEEGAGQGLLSSPADATGKARLSVPAGRYRLKVEAEGRCSARESKLELAAGEERKIALVLEACPSVSGVVVDSQGKPVAGARLQINLKRRLPPRLLPMAMEQGSFVSGVVEATTGPEGQFVLPPLWPIDGYLLDVAQKGFPPYDTPLDLRSGRKMAGLKLVLPAGAEIRGQLIGSDNKPVPGAEAKAVELSRQRPETKQPPVIGSDGDGVFRWTGLPEGWYRVEITPASGQKQFLGPFELEAGQRLDLGRFTVIPGNSISGRVLDREGKGVAEAQVRALRAVGAFRKTERRVRSGADGSFALNGLSGGSYILYVKPREPFLPAESSLLWAPEHDVEITVPRGAVLSGHIRSEDGAPLENLIIRARLTTDSSNEGPIGVAEITDPESGAFRVTGLPAKQVLLLASAVDYIPADPIVFDLHEGDRREQIDIVLKAGQTVNGKVIDQSNGNGVPKAQISLSRWAGSHSAVTDEAGEFRLRGVPVGTVALTVKHPDFALANPDLVVSADRPTFITIPLGRGANLTGTVKTASGTAVPLMRIEVGREGGIPVWTGSDGVFPLSIFLRGRTMCPASAAAIVMTTSKPSESI